MALHEENGKPVEWGFHSRHGNIEEFLSNSFGEEFRRYRNEWLRYKTRETLPAADSAGPLHVNIELIDACDNKCGHCFRMTQPGYNTGARLSVDVYQKIMDEVEDIGVRSISFPDSEPMLHPRVDEILRLTGQRNLREVLLYTNGPRFDARKRAATLDCAAQVRMRLHISLDAATSATYAAVRGGDFDLAIRNIDGFLRESEALGAQRPLLWVTFLIMDTNRHEAEEFYNMWYDKADIIQFQRFIETGGHVAVNPEAIPRTNFCSMPFTTMRIQAKDARLFACCGQFQAFHSLGTFPETGLAAAWNSDTARALRSAIRSGPLPPSCRTCLSL